MITLIMHYTVKEGGEQAFLEAARRVVGNTREHDECIEFSVMQDVERPTEFVLFERWKDDAQLAAHATRLRALREAGGEQAATVPHLSPYAEKSTRGRYRVVV